MTTASTLYVGAQEDTWPLLEGRVREAARAGAEVIRIDGGEPSVASGVRLMSALTGLPHRASWTSHLLVAVRCADRLRESQQRALARIAEIGVERGVTVVAMAEEPADLLAANLEVVRAPHLRPVR